MKNSYIILTLLLIASLIGTFAVYKLFVEERMNELADHQKEEKELRKKIGEMEEKFFGTDPEKILELWRNKKQPWTNAAKNRSEFFQMTKINRYGEVPEEYSSYPKFFYETELPKLRNQLNTMAFDSGTSLSGINDFDVPSETSFGFGTNPEWAELQGHLNVYLYGIELTRMLVEAKATTIKRVAFWKGMEKFQGKGGALRLRTTGYSFTISMRELTELLEELRTADTYFNVNVIKITNSTLRNADSILDVDMVVTEANYVPVVKGTVGSEDGGTGVSIFSGMFNTLRSVDPYAEEDVGFFRRLMMKIFFF